MKMWLTKTLWWKETAFLLYGLVLDSEETTCYKHRYRVNHAEQFLHLLEETQPTTYNTTVKIYMNKLKLRLAIINCLVYYMQTSIFVYHKLYCHRNIEQCYRTSQIFLISWRPTTDEWQATSLWGQYYDLGLLQLVRSRLSNVMCPKNKVSWLPECTEKVHCNAYYICSHSSPPDPAVLLLSDTHTQHVK